MIDEFSYISELSINNSYFFYMKLNFDILMYELINNTLRVHLI